MYSYNDFERLFLRYKLEGIPAGISIEKFCMSNQVPYNLFSKWYKDTQKKIVPVQVLGATSLFWRYLLENRRVAAFLGVHVKIGR